MPSGGGAVVSGPEVINAPMILQPGSSPSVIAPLGVIPESVLFKWTKNNDLADYYIAIRKVTGKILGDNDPRYDGNDNIFLGNVDNFLASKTWFANNGISLEYGYTYVWYVCAVSKKDKTIKTRSTLANFSFSQDILR